MLARVMWVVHTALRDTCGREREQEEEPHIQGPIPSHGPHGALSRGRKSIGEWEEEPHILGPIPSHGPHGALSRGEALQEWEEAPCILGPIPSHGPHGALLRGENYKSGRRHPVYWGPYCPMAHMAHSRGEKTTRAGGGTPYTGAHTVPWPTWHTLEGRRTAIKESTTML
jgi:hypothetical protein